MFTKKLSRSCSVAAITTITFTPTIGKIISLLLSSGKIVKSAKDIKKGYNEVLKMVNNRNALNDKASEENVSNDISEENIIEVVESEVIPKMG